MKLTRSWVVVIAAALCSAGAAAAWHGLGTREAAPAVSYTLLDGSTGSTVTQRDKVLLVNVGLTPTTFLIDKQGRIVKRYLGAPDFAALGRLIGKLLDES